MFTKFSGNGNIRSKNVSRASRYCSRTQKLNATSPLDRYAFHSKTMGLHIALKCIGIASPARIIHVLLNLINEIVNFHEMNTEMAL